MFPVSEMTRVKRLLSLALLLCLLQVNFTFKFVFNANKLSTRLHNADDYISTTKTEENVRANLRETVEVASIQQQKAVNIDTSDNEVTTETFIDNLDSLKIKRPYTSILTERLMQSLDDYQLSSTVKKRYKGLDTYYARRILQQTLRPRVIVLGSGWGAHALLKTIDASQYDVRVISPRNYFAFTPMLAASAVGTVEFRSLCEPIRNVNSLVDYLEASATSIDFESRKVECVSVKCEGTACDTTYFDVDYDYLIISVGASVNTFNIKGVREHCQFLKQVEDAANLRKAIANCFERANIPQQSEEEVRSALSFVIVGAGPTGVEFTSELRDWLEREGRRYYGHLLQYVTVTLVEAGGAVLPVFDETLQKEAYTRLTERVTSLVEDGYISKEIVQVKLKSGVKEVGDKVIEFSSGEKMPYGFCVWAAGNGPTPFILDSINKVDQQKTIQSKGGPVRGRLAIDSWLRVKGLRNVFAIGDCSVDDEQPLPATAQVASQQGAYLGRVFSKGFNMSAPSPLPPYRPLSSGAKEESEGFLSDTVQLGTLGVKMDDKQVEYAKPFQFLNLGILAYIGASQALAQISVDQQQIKSSGPIGFLLWRGIYWFKQVSWRNRALITVDWIKGRVFGRDLGA